MKNMFFVYLYFGNQMAFTWDFDSQNIKLWYIMQFENISDPLAFDDVCLLLDDSNVLLAHRIVLSAASPVFKHVLEDSSQIKNTNISLPSFDYTTMKRLVSFLYSGEAFLDSKEQLNEFIEYCDLFGLKAFRDV